jgi:hypothetical protein
MDLVERYHTLTTAEKSLLDAQYPPAGKLHDALRLPSSLFAHSIIEEKPLGDWMLHAFQSSIWHTSSEPPHMPPSIDVSSSTPPSTMVPPPENNSHVEYILLSTRLSKPTNFLITFYHMNTMRVARLHFGTSRSFDEVTMYGLQRYGQSCLMTPNLAQIEVFSKEDKRSRTIPLSMLLATKQDMIIQLVYREHNGNQQAYLNLPIFFAADN